MPMTKLVSGYKKARKILSEGVEKGYAPIRAISPAAIGGGLVAGHITGGYSGSAAAQMDMYHLGRRDALSKKAAFGGILSAIKSARGWANSAGNTAKGYISNSANSLKNTSIGQSAISNASKVAQSPLGARVINRARMGRSWVARNPVKTAVATGTGGYAMGSMTKSSSLYQKALKSLQETGKKHPKKTALVGGTLGFGTGLGVTHVADEHVDGALGRSALYPYRKKNGYI